MWKFLTVDDKELMALARSQLHQAIQIVAAVGRTYFPKSKEDNFANFKWNKQLEALQGHSIEGADNISVGLDLKNLSIIVISRMSDEVGRFSLDNKTQKQALIWLEEQLVKSGLDGSMLTINLPYEIPEYPTSKGKPFKLFDQEPFIALSDCFSNTHNILQDLISGENRASDIRCWPHHFDIATLITLNDTGNPDTSTSIGAGLSPGDHEYDEPYFYLTPWPYPPLEKLPEMQGPGSWHSNNWVGGVLTYSELIAHHSSPEQKQLVEAFMGNGVENLKGLLSH